MTSREPLPPQPDLSACEREPIHVPGRVQPHGVLLVTDLAGERVLRASANTWQHLNADPADLIDQPLDAAIGLTAAGLLRSKFGAAPTDDNPVHLVTIAVPAADDRRFHVLAHRRHGQLLLELKPAEEREGETVGSLHARALASALRLQSETTVQGLLDAVAREVRRLTGFDRVMAYRFDADDHGEVLAEDVAIGCHAYLGHHFPASDIPPQARSLYLLNRVRLIPDAAYRPADVLPATDPATSRPLDMTYAALRSVSPVHAEYLKNMGVAASMSVSVIVDGRLWGLIACHHRKPHFVPHDVRGACDHLGRVAAAQLQLNERVAEREHRLALTLVQGRLLERMAGSADPVDGLVESAADLLTLADAGGVAIAVGGRLYLLHDTPPHAEVSRLVTWLGDAGRPAVYATDCIALDDPSAGAVGGVLSVALGPAGRDRVVWFRPEVTRTVVWAGDPDKPLGPTDPQARIHPRKSFEAWTQVVRGRSVPWDARHVDAAAAFRAAVNGIVLRKADELADERRRRAEAEAANRDKDRHLAFLAHELRGPLTPAPMAASAMQADEALPAGLRADAAMIRRNIELTTRLADDLLDANRIALGKLELRVEPTDVHESLRASPPMCAADLAEKGVRLVLDPRATRPVVEGDAAKLTQVWANLLKNAAKFSQSGGAVTVRTSDAAGGRVRVEVQDDGVGVDADLLPRMFNLYEQGDRTVTRKYSGLGLGLAICRGIVDAHGGSINASSAGKDCGTTLAVELPAVGSAMPTPAPAAPRVAVATDRQSSRLKILLVDDHEDTLRIMARLLKGLEYKVTTAVGVGPALAAAKGRTFDLLISDVGLGDGSGLDLMRELLARGPMRGIALTGYGTTSDIEATRAAGFAAHLTKPVNFASLQALIGDVVRA